jgi:hypothetical protein
MGTNLILGEYGLSKPDGPNVMYISNLVRHFVFEEAKEKPPTEFEYLNRCSDKCGEDTAIKWKLLTQTWNLDSCSYTKAESFVSDLKDISSLLPFITSHSKKFVTQHGVSLYQYLSTHNVCPSGSERG